MLPILVSAVATAALVWLIRRFALKRGALDVPNDRSSHTRPTPRGGGAGLIAVVLAGMLLFGTHLSWSYRECLALVAVALVSVIGWIDDQRGGVAPRVRIVVHATAGLLIVPLALLAPPLLVPLWLSLGWWVFWFVAAVNVVNFMDGIDGIIGLQAAIFGAHLALNSVSELSGALGMLLVGASIGFLAFNWSPASIFMGDVGSGGLGATFVVGGLFAVEAGGLGFVAAFLPLCPIFLDATVTLVARAIRGERLSEAHRSHLYQRLANRGMGHSRVSLCYAAASLVGLGIVWMYPDVGVIVLASFCLACACTGMILLRRVEESTLPSDH
jgi:Fuc2NAc and GlcNAc transferase